MSAAAVCPLLPGNAEIPVFTSWLRTIAVGLLLLSALEPLLARMQTTAGTNDFAFLDPWFTVGQKDRDTLAQRGVVVHGLPASHKQIGIVAACAIDMSADQLEPRASAFGADAIGNVKNELIAGRFSEPPTLDDLARLTLDQEDINRLRACRRGECALNLADHEMSELQLALTQAPEASAGVQDAFRRVILARLARYRAGGLAALPEYHDRQAPVQPAAVFAAIRQQIPYLKGHVPAVVDYLERFPTTDATGTSTSLHWSRVIVNGKPVVSIHHLTTFRPRPGPRVPTVLTVAQTIYSSRYMNGELTLWMLFAPGNASSYLVYVTRSELDTLGGSFSSLKRTAIESRMKEAAARLLNCKSSIRN